MRVPVLTLLAVLGAVAATSAARAQMSCGQHRAVCESVCTPERVAYVYAGSGRRCSASCEPRWQMCLKTGVWVDLERRSSGGSEFATPF